MILIDLIQS